MRDSFVMVRDHLGDGEPGLPAGWTGRGSRYWWHLTDAQSNLVDSLFINDHPTAGKGIFLMFGENRGRLVTLARTSDYWGTLKSIWARAALPNKDDELAIMERWTDWRIRGEISTERDNSQNPNRRSADPEDVERILSPLTGIVLPIASPFPWNLDKDGSVVTEATAYRKVNSIDTPSTYFGMAGFEDDKSAEDTESQPGENPPGEGGGPPAAAGRGR